MKNIFKVSQEKFMKFHLISTKIYFIYIQVDYMRCEKFSVVLQNLICKKYLSIKI